MWRILGTEDFTEARKGSQNGLGDWWSCSHYEIHDGLIKAAYPFDPKHWGEDGQWRVYTPLVDNPDLFLRFARLYDRGYSEDSILDWTRTYGLLGSFYGWRGGGRKEAETTLLEDVAGGAFRYEGGPGTTVAGFWDEVCWAAGVVAAYEARLNRDYAGARSLLTGEFAFLEIAASGVERGWWWGQLEKRFGEQVAEELALLVSEKNLAGIKKFTTREPDLAERIVLELNGPFLFSREEPEFLGVALNLAHQTVEEKVRLLCYPRLIYGDDECSYSSTGPRAGWGARNLLGAMYLQMYWLMTSGGDLARCEYCGRLITLSRPNPSSRKRRSDKRFCDDACRQAHHRSKKKT